MAADWFERLTGFREEGYELTRSRLVVDGDELVSTVNGARYAVGELLLRALRRTTCGSGGVSMS